MMLLLPLRTKETRLSMLPNHKRVPCKWSSLPPRSRLRMLPQWAVQLMHRELLKSRRMQLRMMKLCMKRDSNLDDLRTFLRL